MDARQFPITEGRLHIFRRRGEWAIHIDTYRSAFDNEYQQLVREAHAYVRRLSNPHCSCDGKGESNDQYCPIHGQDIR